MESVGRSAESKSRQSAKAESLPGRAGLGRIVRLLFVVQFQAAFEFPKRFVDRQHQALPPA
jgi:hypothetical protein